MEPYNPNLPFISIANDGKTVLDRMVEAGIPFTRALQYFRNNPEGSALETLKLAAEDVIPFYGNYRNDGDVSDYAKEAVLMFTPVKGGGRKKLNVTKEGPFNELKDWADYKVNQYNEFLQDNPKQRLREAQAEMDYAQTMLRKYPEFADNIQTKMPALEQKVNEAAIEAIDASPYYDIVEDWGRIPEGTVGRLPAGEVGGSRYVYNRLVEEYGPELGTYYYHKLWNADMKKYPHPQDIGVESGLLERMFETYYK